MKNKINTIAMFFFFLLGTTSLHAQLSLGPGLAYGFDVEEIGLQVRGVYGINETWRGAGDFIYYLDGTEGISFWELNLNGHYIFYDNGSARVYALAGLNFFHLNIDLGIVDGSDTEAGINIGTGGELSISDGIKGFGEFKYSVSDADQLLLALGILFNF